jgi:hypothetical protein
MSASHYTAEMRIGMVHPSRLAPAFVFLSGVDASFATEQRFNAFHLSEANAVRHRLSDGYMPPPASERPLIDGVEIGGDYG